MQFAKDVIEEPYITKNDIDMDKNIAVGEEPEIQVLMGSNYDQEYDDTSQPYQGDVLPGHLHESKLKYLTKMYKAVPEEFYTQTKRRPVTPNNARSWMRKRRGGQRGGQRTTPPRTINPDYKTHRGAEISRLEKKTKPPKVYCECIAVCLRATWGPTVFKTLCLAGFSAGHG